MSNFINTVDLIDDDVLIDSLIEKSFSGSFNDDKVTQIKAHAFADCTNLNSVCFPNATNICSGAFNGSGLKAITPETFPLVTGIGYLYTSSMFAESALETVDWPSLTSIHDGSIFSNCSSLKSVSLPNLITTDASSMFQDCVSLKSVNLPKVTSVGNSAFQGCTSLESINLSEVINIGNYSFKNCTSLTRMVLPKADSLGGIAYGQTFDGCTSLRFVDLPMVTLIPYAAFLNCSSLIALVIRTDAVPSARNEQMFNGTPIASGAGYIYVPRDLINSYATANYWSTYAAKYRPLEDYTVDGTTTGAMREHCEGLALNVTELTFTDANPYTLTPTVQPGIFDEINWTTSDKTVAKVNNGVVTPVGDGTATITVTCGEYSTTCAVTVNAGLVAPVHVIELAPYDGSEEGELPFYKLDVAAGQMLEITYYLTKQQGYIYDGRNCGMQYYGSVGGSAYPIPSNEVGVETTKTITIVSDGTITFSGHHQETVSNGELVSYAPDRVYGKYLYVTIT